jgi:hypothetical protein
VCVEDLEDSEGYVEDGEEVTAGNGLCAFTYFESAVDMFNILVPIEQARVFIEEVTVFHTSLRALDNDDGRPDGTDHVFEREVDGPVTMNEEEIVDKIGLRSSGYRGVIGGMPNAIEEEHDTPFLGSRRLDVCGEGIPNGVVELLGGHLAVVDGQEVAVHELDLNHGAQAMLRF